MPERTMTSDKARSQWGELLESALKGVATIITRRGRPVAVVLSEEEYRQLQEQARLGREIQAGQRVSDFWQAARAALSKRDD